MKKLSIIGIGAGHPDHITVQAIKALNAIDVIFMIDKGYGNDAMARLRRQICERYIKNKSCRIVHAKDPERDRAPTDYQSAVSAWHSERAAIYETLLEKELADGQHGGFLVWGDPALYDSTLRIVEQIAAKQTVAFDYEVIPGITSVQALASGHRVALNRIGSSVHITTGRQLANGIPAGLDDVVVMLDGDCAFKKVRDDDVEIYWGAYVGTDDEILISGKLRERMAEIERVRSEARQQHGWIMDTYLLRRNGDS
jgi:precorrin-6A synthase